MKLPSTSTLNLEHLGSAVVADFDADGAIEILIPVCSDGHCRKVGTILMWTRNRGWVHFQLDLKEFDLLEYDSNRNDFLFRVGDFSLDGYPDLIVTTVLNNRVTPMILENVEYPDNANFSRKFELKSSSRFVMPAEMSQGNVQMSAFFDLKEDGNLDILVEYKHDGVLKFDFIKCDDKGDTTFLKVQIFTNICSDCRKAIGEPGTQKGSGISWHGACASFRTTDPSDNYRLSSQCQIPQTSHRALYSPYVLFGLGRSPNFIEVLKFGTPRQVDMYGTQHHQILQIVPNSRIIAIPPKGQETYWQIRLYLTASSLIIQSLFVLMTVCGLLILVVIILHMREKHADKKERQAQSHRFHFDAM
jgi:integrin alpha FG-GAP repeat containing protein 1